MTQYDFYADMEHANPDLNTTIPAPLHEIMESWTSKIGYPLLTVSRAGDGSYQVKQVSFMASVKQWGLKSRPLLHPRLANNSINNSEPWNSEKIY